MSKERISKDKVEQVRDNWTQSFADNPTQTKKTVRAMLRKSPRNVAMVEKAIKGRARRFMLRKAGALAIIEAEIKSAKEYYKTNEAEKGL